MKKLELTKSQAKQIVKLHCEMNCPNCEKECYPMWDNSELEVSYGFDMVDIEARNNFDGLICAEELA